MLDDPDFLKQYVKQHPDNKMGWYLLGKHYASIGNSGKARYCFAKAGEIFEAFENDGAPEMRVPPELQELIRSTPPPKLPVLPAAAESAAGGVNPKLSPSELDGAAFLSSLAALMHTSAQPEEKPMSDNEERAKRKKLSGYVVRTAVSLVLFIGVLLAPVSTITQDKAYGPGIHAASPGLSDEANVYWTAAAGGKQAIDDTLRLMLSPDTPKAGYTVLVQLPSSGDGKWLFWEQKPKVILSIERTNAAEQFRVQYHDEAACSCTPSDPAKAESIVSAWMSGQEQEAVLHSAMKAYQGLFGALPEQIDGLTRHYPQNIIPGYTPFMANKYQQLTSVNRADAQVVSAAVTPGQGAKPASSDSQGGGGAGGSPLSPPLEIVVDRAAHRLALISGNVIVRSYPVGLGGSRTPDGEFTITEKVMNPNGHSNGDFGSRGMTLSNTLYAIHGTNQPSSIGKDSSLGCVRMLNEDIEELYDLTPLGTHVKIGSGILPGGDIKKAGIPLQIPHLRTETNPGKRYNWLE